MATVSRGPTGPIMGPPATFTSEGARGTFKRQARELLQQDIEALRDGADLGFTEAQKRQQLAAATQQAAAQAAASQGQIARAGLAGGIQGADIQALLAGQQGTAQAGAAASQKIQQASQQQAQQQEARIREAVERQQKRGKDSAEKAADTVVNVVAGAAEAVAPL
jgi:hypothetical protein